MNVIIVGCGRIGAELAYHLYLKGHKVSVVDLRLSNFQNLDPKFQGRTIEGDALNENVLRRSGIETANGLAAVTNSDTYNLVIAHIARSVYGLNNVVVRNYNPQWIPLYDAFGFQTVSSSSWGAKRIEELLFHTEVRTVFSAGNGEIGVYEFSIPPELSGRKVSDLFINTETCPVAITRAGHAMLTDGNIIIETGDILLISSSVSSIEEIKTLLHLNKEP